MIGIVTFHTALNYGAVLQAYGLQKFLDNNGYKNEIINYDCPQFKKDYAPVKITIHIKRMIRSFKSRKITIQLRDKYREFVQKDLIYKIGRFLGWYCGELSKRKIVSTCSKSSNVR